MPLNFPEQWQSRVRTQLTSATQAPWLDGVEELDTAIIEVGSGDASEQNLIHIPTSTFRPDVLINNTTYPIALQQYDDDGMTIALDKYQTKVTPISDDQIIGSSYARIDNATKQHVIAILTKKFGKAIHAIAPASNTDDTPVILTSGEVIGNRRRMRFEDIVALKSAHDQIDDSPVGRRLVLSTDHWNDLLIDESNKYFNKLLVDFKTGQPAPVIAGFETYSYINNPYYTSAGVKNPFGSVPTATDHKASVSFNVQNTVKKTGLTKQYFAQAYMDPENQTNRLNYRHYFICVPVFQKYIGAIASAPSA